jgi:hypothetical protein
MKTSRKITLAILIGTKLLIAATNAHAQDLMNIDVNAMNNAWNAQQNATMNDQLSQMIWANANDPYVQQVYVQQVNAGLFYGSIEEFAYKWIVTGGKSDAGYARAMDTNAQIDQQHQTMMNGYWDSMGNYQGAYNDYTGGYAENQAQAGMIMLGN